MADPFDTPGYRYAVNEFEGDGVTTDWNIEFDGRAPGYISIDHVRASVEDDTGVETPILLSQANFVLPTRVNITPAVPAGSILRIWRDTPKSVPLLDYTDGAFMTERNLDTSNEQALYAVAEMVDRFADALTDTQEFTEAVLDRLVDVEDTANDADSKSDTAIAVANSAVSTAASAVTTANAAMDGVAGAEQAAIDATAAADAANAGAAAATTAANNANQAATDALGTSAAALTTAQNAETVANGIAGTAQQALDNSVAAVNDASAALTGLSDLANPSDPAKGAAMVGWKAAGVGAVDQDAAKKLGQIIDARDYGFSASGSSAGNRDALLRAVTIAQGAPVIVQADTDFPMMTLILAEMPVDLRFQGAGRWNRPLGEGIHLRSGGYTDIFSITDFARTSVTIDGTTTTATRLTVADNSAYQRGDVVRVVSDDVDLDADAASGASLRRRGESAIVCATGGSNYIYLAGWLEDYNLYLDNPRVGKMSTTPFSIRNLRVNSSLDNTSSILYMNAPYKPHIELDVRDHGSIVVSSNGAYRGNFYLNGSGKGTSGGSLGYLFNDISGTQNTLHSPRGQYFRHIQTTNHNTVVANSNSLHLYGATRDHTVLYGVAESAQGVPWDEHPGARRTKWVGCSAMGRIGNTSTAGTAYQCRGRDAQIIDPYTDRSYVATLRVNPYTRGEVTVSGGRSECPELLSMNTADPLPISVKFINHTKETASGNGYNHPGLFPVHIIGGVIRITNWTSPDAKIFGFTEDSGSAPLYLHNPLVDVTYSETSPAPSTHLFRFSRAADVSVVGSVTVSTSSDMVGFAHHVGSSDGIMRVKSSWIKGWYGTSTSGSGTRLSDMKYLNSRPAGAADTNVTDFTDYVNSFGGM